MASEVVRTTMAVMTVVEGLLHFICTRRGIDFSMLIVGRKLMDV